MTEEELFFKENYPEYVTEKGEFLTPYWDLFRAGVICAIFESKVKIEQLEKENADLKALRKYELNVSKLEIEKLEKENKGLKARFAQQFLRIEKVGE